MTLSKGTAADIMQSIRAFGSVWVHSGARATVRRMAAAGLVNYFPEHVMDPVTMHGHEEYHVVESARSARDHKAMMKLQKEILK